MAPARRRSTSGGARVTSSGPDRLAAIIAWSVSTPRRTKGAGPAPVTSATGAVAVTRRDTSLELPRATRGA